MFSTRAQFSSSVGSLCVALEGIQACAVQACRRVFRIFACKNSHWVSLHSKDIKAVALQREIREKNGSTVLQWKGMKCQRSPFVESLKLRVSTGFRAPHLSDNTNRYFKKADYLRSNVYEQKLKENAELDNSRRSIHQLEAAMLPKH